MIIKGGHAIMLRVELEPKAKSAVDKFVSYNVENRYIKGDFHITLAFVGRNLTGQQGHAIRSIAKELSMKVPHKLGLIEIDKFGRNKDHVVMMVAKSQELMDMRGWIEYTLSSNMYSIKQEWKPHVTLCIMEQVYGEWDLISMMAGNQLNDLKLAAVDTEATVKALIAKTGDRITEYGVTYT